MRFKHAAAFLMSLACAFSLRAQVEPNLLTATDLSDVYKSKSGTGKLVLILDSTAASRGVFETYDYLTNKARTAFLGSGAHVAPNDVGSNDSVFFKPGGANLNQTNPILGYVFGMRQNGTRAEVRLYSWPSSSPVKVRTTVNGSTDLVGYPMAHTGTGTAMAEVPWNSSVLDTLKHTAGNPVTHIRFSLTIGTGGNAVTRTVDVPCPWALFDSPSFVAEPPAPTTATPFPTIQPYQRNFTRRLTYQTGHTGIPYDVYSNTEANATRDIDGYTDKVIGQFYYSPDYLSWIFYGKSVRGSYPLTGNKAGAVDWKYPNGFGYAGGYAVPSVTDNTTVSNGSGGTATAKGEGFANHLPVMYRLQAEKVAVINAFVDKWGLGVWYYRFLAPGYGDPDNDEELTATAYATPTTYRADRTGAETNAGYLSDIRSLTGSLLEGGTSALQNIGPKNLAGTQTKVLSQFGNNEDTFDAFTPNPMAVALANTYRKIVRDTTKFGSGSCGGEVVVVPLAATAMNDSLTSLGDQKAAYVSNSSGYYSYTHGNSGLSKGGSNYPETGASAQMASGNFVPGSDYFHPAVMAAFAAFGLNGVTNNSSNYDAPWNDPTSRKTMAIQTMAVSLAVPGTYVLASDNNGRNPHEEFFDMAQWGNPKNPRWSASNPAPSSDLIYYYQPANSNNVRYFPTADPTTLEQAIKSAASYIVYGKAALSAPATPATGVQNANQAYFGTFQTTATTSASARVPLWTGNLYSIGLKRTTIPGPTLGSVQNIIQFYGVDDATGTTATINNTGTNTADFDVLNLWSAYIIFGNYQNVTVNTGKILGNAPLSWRNRTAYIVSGGNDLETYTHTANGNSSNGTQLDRIIGWMTAKDPTNRYYLSSTVAASGLPTRDNARNLMRFLLGAFDPASDTNLKNRDKTDTDSSGNSLGHLNIMGDIVDSAPLAIELSKSLANTLPSVVTGDAFFTQAYGSNYTDPHTRLVIVGTNTGNLHCFVEVAAKPLANNADGYFKAKAYELWTFLPPNLFPMLWDLYNQRTQTDPAVYKHHYGVDGDAVLYHVDKPSSGSVTGDTRVGSGEDATVIFSFRKGARDYFAITLSRSGSGFSSVTPASPRLAWWIRPTTGDIVTPSATSSANASLIRTMGMSTCVPTFGLVRDGSGNLQRCVFITGGYANDEINARYLNDDARASTSYFQNGLGRLILALDPMTGAHVRTTPWDFRTVPATTTVGAIAGGVIPVSVIDQAAGLTNRIYFGDMTGGVWALNADASARAEGFRADSAAINDWLSSERVRLIYRDASVRFTTAPDAFRLPGDFPVLVPVGDKAVKPVTVMVAIGAGDRNNPADYPEDFSYVNSSLTTVSATRSPAAYNRLYVLADLQNSTGAITDSQLQSITSAWATSYSDARVSPGTSTYMWGQYSSATNEGSGYKYGWYVDLPHNDSTNPLLAAAGDSTNYTRDKVLVSPLIKDGAVFYSFFNIYGSSGFACSPFSTTRTFRQCDVMRPLYYNPQIDVTATKVGDITNGTGTSSVDGCSGLAFSFNSLSSQLVDAGDYVMQGGAKASLAAGTQGANTPDIQAVKDTSSARGFRIRNWRVVR